MGNPGVQTPTRLGRYELLARIATGGMGEIFLARLEGAAGFEKMVVVKRILPHLADDARFRQMLIAEARLASRLSHANICQVYELGETDGQLYIVMEYMEGVTLLPLLRKKSKAQHQLEFGFVGGIVQQTSDALHFAHELRDRGGENVGLVHRDVTPSNIFLTESGVAKVLDFGIAKVKDASAQTQTGTVKGKYAYMAPEQLRGGMLDRRADVFALGVCVFEMLALRRLFQRKTDYLTFRAVMEQPIPDVRRYRADVPEPLALVLAQALDRDPDRRFDTARQFGTAVLDALAPLGRTWTQGDISDFVREEFRADLARRSARVAGAVSRKAGVDASRSTMPLIAHDEPSESELDDEDDEFPAVDSTVNEAPMEFRATRPPQETRDFSGQSTQATPLPFGAESSVSGVALQALPPGVLPPGLTVVTQRPGRSIVWPLIAVGMLAITATALFLVWKQMQNQQPPAVVNITSESTRRDPDPGPGSAGAVTPDAPVAGSGSAVTPPPIEGTGPDRDPVVKRPPTPPGPARNPYNVALQGNIASMKKCAVTHGAPVAKMQVKMVVSTNGRSKTVEFEPAAINGTPLGACIKNVLSDVVFPAATEEKNLSFSVSASG